MMRMDPHELPRLLAIEQDTHRLLDEARTNGWAGEVAGLEITLQRIQHKKAQVERIQATTANTPVWLASKPRHPTGRRPPIDRKPLADRLNPQVNGTLAACKIQARLTGSPLSRSER